MTGKRSSFRKSRIITQSPDSIKAEPINREDLMQELSSLEEHNAEVKSKMLYYQAKRDTTNFHRMVAEKEKVGGLIQKVVKQLAAIRRSLASKVIDDGELSQADWDSYHKVMKYVQNRYYVENQKIQRD